jgi:hypothetical protein
VKKEAKTLQNFKNQNFNIISFRHQTTSGDNLPSDWESCHLDVETMYCYSENNQEDKKNIFSISIGKTESSVVIKFLKYKLLKEETLLSDIKQQILRVCAYHGFALCCLTFPADDELKTILKTLRDGHRYSLSLNLKSLKIARNIYGEVTEQINPNSDDEQEIKYINDRWHQEDQSDYYIIEDDMIKYQDITNTTQNAKTISFRKFGYVAFRHIVAPYAMIKTLGPNAHVAVMNRAVVHSCETRTAIIKVRHGCPFSIQKEYQKLSDLFYDQYRLFLHYQRNNFPDIGAIKDRLYMIRDDLTSIRDHILDTSVEFITGTQEGNRVIFELADGQILTAITDDTLTRHKFVIEKIGTSYSICVKKYTDTPELFEEYDFRESS